MLLGAPTAASHLRSRCSAPMWLRERFSCAGLTSVTLLSSSGAASSARLASPTLTPASALLCAAHCAGNTCIHFFWNTSGRLGSGFNVSSSGPGNFFSLASSRRRPSSAAGPGCCCCGCSGAAGAPRRSQLGCQNRLASSWPMRDWRVSARLAGYLRGRPAACTLTAAASSSSVTRQPARRRRPPRGRAAHGGAIQLRPPVRGAAAPPAAQPQRAHRVAHRSNDCWNAACCAFCKRTMHAQGALECCVLHSSGAAQASWCSTHHGD